MLQTIVPQNKPRSQVNSSSLREARAAAVEVFVRNGWRHGQSTNPACPVFVSLSELLSDLAGDITGDCFTPESIETAIDDLVREARVGLSVNAETGRISIIAVGCTGGHK
jgi:hypothetical protein